MTCWRNLLLRVIHLCEEDPSTLVCTLSNQELDVEFDDGYGDIEGLPFAAWTTNYVYFPLCYDGSEWVGYAHRNPTESATQYPIAHQGGG